jgi:hypothetical protein
LLASKTLEAHRAAYAAFVDVLPLTFRVRGVPGEGLFRKGAVDRG